MKFSLSQIALMILCAASLVPLYQNCGSYGAAQFSGLQNLASTLPNTPGATATPLPSGPPVLNSWTDPFPAPERAADCMTNPKYNLCVVSKDPVSTYGGAFSPLFTPNTATAAQETATFIYGVKVPTTAFSNTNYTIVIPAANRVALTANNDWKHRYAGDTRAYVAQLNAWFWLNRQVSMMTSRSGKFWNAARNARVNVRDTTILDNAYFSDVDNSINFGLTDFGINNNTNRGDLALDIGVITHEAGHGNISAATNAAQASATKEVCNSNGCFCRTNVGCFDGIHEGAADFHALILFPEQGGAMGGYFFNSLAGLRNVDTVRATQTANSLFTQTNPVGEIHNVGQVYTAVWYGVWKKWKVTGTEKDIETLFTSHLAGLNGNDDFVTAYNTLNSIAANLFPAKAAQIRADFRAEYMAMGLTVPP